MRLNSVCFCLVFLFLVICFLAVRGTQAQSGNLILEAEQHWDTYGVGGTCISGTHNLFLADVDGDGIMEIITGGSTYWLKNGSQTAREAPLKIWNWNGQNLSLEKSQNWAGSIGCVYAGDANGEGTIEIITAGSIRNDTGSYPQLGIWQWKDEALVPKASYEGASVSSVSISDVDKDGTPEIFTVGRIYNNTQFSSQLSAWHWEGNSLTLRNSVEWGTENTTRVNSVCVYDLDGDGMSEVITGGYANNLKNSSGNLRIWRWNEEGFSLKADEEWRLKDNVYGLTIAGGVQGNTVVNNVKVGDVDSDGTPEIVTGGFAYDGEKTNAQLRIWNWSDQVLTLEKSQEWTAQDLVEVKSISINDVDGDGRKEIVTSGAVGVVGSFGANMTSPTLAQLRVWGWDGATLTLKQSQDWYVDDGATAWNVATGDVDKDGVIEIVTVGCTALSNTCDPDMRIWSIAKNPMSFSYTLWAAIGIAAVIAMAIAFILWRKKW